MNTLNMTDMIIFRLQISNRTFKTFQVFALIVTRERDVNQTALLSAASFSSLLLVHLLWVIKITPFSDFVTPSNIAYKSESAPSLKVLLRRTGPDRM